MKIISALFGSLVIFFSFIPQASADVGIIVAMNASVEALKKEIKIDKIQTVANREFIKGQMGDKKVVIVRSPMGKVNNAITTQLLISNFPIDSVLSLSPAGGIKSKVNIGDVVVANSLFHHDFGTVKPYGFVVSRIPDGINWEKDDYTRINGRMTNRAMLYKPKKGSKSVIHKGVVVSGDQFIASPQKKEWLRKKYNATAVDMGAAAIGQVCQANAKPLCIIRVITDKATVVARSDFEQSVEAYRTDIKITKLMKSIVVH